MRNFLRILIARDFWPLFSGMFFGAFNDNFIRQALLAILSFGALGLSSEETTVFSSLAMGAMILPFFLFSSVAGELSDRFRKSTLLKLYKITELVFMLFAALFFYMENYRLLLLTLFFMGTQSAFFGPVKYSFLPEILKKDHLVAGNGLVEGFTFIAIVLGTVAGSYFSTLDSGPTVILPAGLIIVAALGLGFSLFQPKSIPEVPGLAIRKNIAASTWDILKTAKKQNDVWFSIILNGWFWGMGSILLSQTPNLVSRFGGTPGVNTFMVTMFAVGVAVGSLVVQFASRGKISLKLVPGSAALLTIFLIYFSYCVYRIPEAPKESISLSYFLSHFGYLRLALACFLVSFTSGFFVVPLNALIQHRPDSKVRSRVIAANNIMNSLFMVLGALIAIVMTKMGFSLFHIFCFISFTGLIVTIAAMWAVPDEIFKQLALLIMWVLYRPKVIGLEILEKIEGPILLIPNHTSFLDVALLVCYCPMRLTFAIDATWAKVWWVRPFLRFFTAIPIDPIQPATSRGIIQALKEGAAVAIFPEGRITTTGSLMKIHEGPGFIASHARVPLLPVVIDGAEFTIFGRMRQVLINMPARKKVKITFFPPVHLNYELKAGEVRKDLRKRLAEDIYEIMLQFRAKTRDCKHNLYDALLAEAKRAGKRRVILGDITKKNWTYSDLIKRSKIIGKALLGFTERNSYVGILLPNTSVLSAVLYGLWAGGRIPMVLNHTQGLSNLSDALFASEAKVIVSSRSFAEKGKLTELCEKLPARIVYLEDLKIGFKEKISGLLWSPKPLPYDSPAAILFTSGSEGHPKGVALSHENILSDIRHAKCLIEINEDDILFNAMPAFHAFGLNIGILLPPLLGLRSFNYVSPLHVKTIPELIYDSRATVVLGSDTFASAWAKNAHPYDFNRVRFLILGAEKVRPETSELYFHKMSVRLFEGYGVTEAAPVVSINSKIRVRDGSVGQFIPGMQVKIDKVPGIEKGGKLSIKGPNVMMGYIEVDNPGVINPPPDGWHDTGDIVEIDDEGFVWIKGRFKRFAKVSGEMISLARVEEAAGLLWPGEIIAVLSVPDQAKGERLLLVTKDDNPDMAALRAAIKEFGLSEICVPKIYLTVKDIPLTPMGKVDFPKLQEIALEMLAEKEGKG
jgi:acyl-[acyl-carrier-protein]-phospholipid O-acyltransferase/long-chain-fatty-acid--[acyl-carrier-protein] ligase